uniref:RRM domain-containing protein n=1 Tax=Laticauda laticaudata TaxID=8630 RepID=A0A8C5RI78_LATLA
MTVTLVCDPSEATELCASQQLYLKPVAKLTISVVLPEHTGSTRAFSKWEVMDKLKNMISPDQFSSVKVSKSTKAFVRFEGEAETKRLVSILKEKLHGQRIKLNGFKEELEVVATEAPPDGPPTQESEPQPKAQKQPEEEQSQAVPDCVHLEGLPCKWFAPKGSDSETPSEEVLRTVFGPFGEIRNVDIPMLDPYREETMSRSRNHFAFRGMRSFEAFVQYQVPESFARAMETLKGMKLMFKGDDGKALACNIKVTPDATNHFSENAIKQRTLERLTLQGLERERKREENRGRKGTERKRRDDEDKKSGEGRRRFKIKRREKRRIEREEKHPRKHMKATAAEGLNSPDLPEWEERKYLLAQRRVESIRLLTVLLSQIKNFALSSEQTKAHLPESQPEQEKTFSTPPVEDVHKEEMDAPDLEHPEVENETQPTCPSTLLENVMIDEEKDAPFLAEEFPTSPPSFRRALPNEPTSRAVTSHLTENDAHPFPAAGFLQVTVTQDCQAIKLSPDRWDYLRPHLRSFAEAPEAAQAKKQKVYETEEFIHYLLNYYQTPRYARICPSPQSPSDASWWNRVVSCSGDGFRVKLKNRDEDCWTEESLGSDLPENEPQEDDGDPWEIIDARSEPAEGQAGPQEFSRGYPGEWDDSLEGEEESVGSPPDSSRSPLPGSNNTAHQKTLQEQSTELVALSSPTMYKLKDLLEEISSDSEYFSEALNESRNPSEQRNGGYQGSYQTWPPHQQKAKELLIRVQNVDGEDQEGRCSTRSFCSSMECCGSPGMKPKTRLKRSGGKLWYEEPQIQWPSSEEGRDLSRKRKKKRKRFSDSAFQDEEAPSLEINHRGGLEAFSEIQRECSKLIRPNVKCRTLPALEETIEIKDLMHFSASPLQEEAPRVTRKGNMGAVSERRRKAEDGQRLSRRLVER